MPEKFSTTEFTLSPIGITRFMGALIISGLITGVVVSIVNYLSVSRMLPKLGQSGNANSGIGVF